MARVGHPEIPGLVYQRDLGAGGFADVYLYRRSVPERLVAVKVLRTTDMSDKLAKRFTAEANAMAALAHPHIAQVFSSGVTNDGRPYIEMAYYPNGSLEDRVRKEPLSVPDVLRIGVQLCSAVETAHRLNPPLLHRDIKPANVLIDEYGDPVLTDFGIASRMNEDEDDDASLSVYWASPETMFSTSPVDKRSDVYSLGAMLWHLLVGRAPYVIPGGDNRPSSTMLRTRDLPIPSTGRPDVPASLERLLAQTMSKNPAMRPATAADLARALNAVEQNEYGFGRVTPFKVKMDAAQSADNVRPAPTELDRTRFKAAPQVVPAQIAPAPTATLVTPSAAAPSLQQPSATITRGAPSLDGRTVRRSEPATTTDSPEADEHASSGSKVGLIIALVVVVLVIAGGTWWLLRPGPSAPTPAPTSGAPSRTPGLGLNLPPGPVQITCQRNDDQSQINCSWTYQNDLDTDTYQVKLPDGSEANADTPKYSGPATAGQQYCIQVKVNRADGRYPGDWSEQGCA